MTFKKILWTCKRTRLEVRKTLERRTPGGGCNTPWRTSTQLDTTTILSDSRSAITNFARSSIGETAARLLPTRKSTTTNIRWFPAHVGPIAGGAANRNETADDVARELAHRAAPPCASTAGDVGLQAEPLTTKGQVAKEELSIERSSGGATSRFLAAEGQFAPNRRTKKQLTCVLSRLAVAKRTAAREKFQPASTMDSEGRPAAVIEDRVVRSSAPDPPIPDVDYAEYLRTVWRKSEERTALIKADTGERCSYQELEDACCRVAYALSGLGFQPGDMAGIHCDTSLDAMLAFYGTVFAGGSMVFAKPSLTARKPPPFIFCLLCR
ncbi:hypothetical protein HPB48_002262 [Haemaphysalis longicornis]|uniref:AMP-dependent synthetase/ligase domain-containing protein n=1 Tax=Haemaphysalis longicornis TaxID=44386 RepID=A0A9J6FK18_HAELO|nr:hypothetical protein HPB48_002262 [Haemaphysalis longicornis]